MGGGFLVSAECEEATDEVVNVFQQKACVRDGGGNVEHEVTFSLDRLHTSSGRGEGGKAGQSILGT